eukprot:1194735-Prorocentrum_minimum.AAC.2
MGPHVRLGAPSDSSGELAHGPLYRQLGLPAAADRGRASTKALTAPVVTPYDTRYSRGFRTTKT